jgi:hypothetical protein
MESLVSELAACLADRAAGGNAQWYALDIDAQLVGGLSVLLKMASEAYEAMCLEIGWVKPFKGRHGVSFTTRSLTEQAFFASQPIPFELCRAKVPTASKRHWFLRLGSYAAQSFTPAEQFSGRRLERVQIDCRRLDRLKLMVNRLQVGWGDVNLERDPLMASGEAAAANAKSPDGSEALRKRLQTEVVALVNSLSSSDLQSFITDYEDLFGIVQHLVFQRRSRQVRKASIALGTKILEPNVDFDPSRFQVLGELRAPIDCRYLAYIIQDILELDQVTNSSILALVKAGNGRESPCVVIRNNRKRNCETVGFVLRHAAMTAGSMAALLLRQDEEGVLAALKKEGVRVASRAMPALMTQAMANLASLGDNNMTIIRRFTRLHFGWQVFASLATMRAVAGSQGLEPQCLSAMVEGKTVNFTLKRVDDVLLHELSTRAVFFI